MPDKFVNQTGLARVLANVKAAFALKSHVHSAGDITSGTINVDLIPEATTSKKGLITGAEKAKLAAMYSVADRYKGFGASETFNPFDPLKDQRILIDRLDNAFYFLDKRYSVSVVKTNSQGNQTTWSAAQVGRLFNCIENDNGSDRLYDDEYITITMDFSGGNANGVFPNYPYGYVYIDFYANATPLNVTARVYGRHTGNEYYWSNLSPYPDPKNLTSNNRWIVAQTGMYNMQKLELVVYGTTNSARGFTVISNIAYYLSRAASNKDMPYLSKLREETLYYNLTAPGFIGPLTGDVTGKVNGHTVSADVPANAVFTDTTYSAATQSATGLMSFADKTKLDGIEALTDAEVLEILEPSLTPRE